MVSQCVWLSEGLTVQGGAVGWSVKEFGRASLGSGQLGDLKRSRVTVVASAHLSPAANQLSHITLHDSRSDRSV